MGDVGKEIENLSKAITIIRNDMSKSHGSISDNLFKNIPEKIKELKEKIIIHIEGIRRLIKNCKELNQKNAAMNIIDGWIRRFEYYVAGWWRWYSIVGIGFFGGLALGGCITAAAISLGWCPPCEIALGIGATIAVIAAGGSVVGSILGGVGTLFNWITTSRNEINEDLVKKIESGKEQLEKIMLTKINLNGLLELIEGEISTVSDLSLNDYIKQKEGLQEVRKEASTLVLKLKEFE